MNTLEEKLGKNMAKLRGFIRRQKYIKVAYLFGSAAKGRTGPLSDIDLAFYLDEKLTKGQRSDKLLSLINSISDILKTDKFDVVIMNDMDLLFRFNVIKEGKILDCKDEHFRVLFETDVVSKFLDRDYYDRMYIEKDLERISRKGIL